MASPPAEVASSPTGHPLRIRHFRNLWIGATVSLFGDQFYLVALPWLVLQLTASSLALGTILMAAAVPRAVLMLAGGVVSDRFPPRKVLIVTGLTRAALVAAVAVLTGLDLVRLWHLFALAFGFGVADAFWSPASAALVPSMVSAEQYAPANALFHASAELSMLLGPAPAGLVVKRWGLAAAFWVDALSFLGVILALGRVPDRPAGPAWPPSTAMPGVLGSIADGLRYVVRDPALRTLLLVSAVLNLSMAGPLSVGLAVMAKFRFGSPAAYGMLLSCLGGGAVVGMLAAGAAERLARAGWLLIALMFAMAGTLLALAVAHRLIPVAAILVGMGLCAGAVNIQVITWIQRRVAPEMLGRVMSVLMFSAVGLLPLSLVAAGAVAQGHLAALFVAAGGIILSTAFVVVFTPAARAI